MFSGEGWLCCTSQGRVGVGGFTLGLAILGSARLLPRGEAASHLDISAQGSERVTEHAMMLTASASVAFAGASAVKIRLHHERGKSVVSLSQIRKEGRFRDVGRCSM